MGLDWETGLALIPCVTLCVTLTSSQHSWPHLSVGENDAHHVTLTAFSQSHEILCWKNGNHVWKAGPMSCTIGAQPAFLDLPSTAPQEPLLSVVVVDSHCLSAQCTVLCTFPQCLLLLLLLLQLLLCLFKLVQTQVFSSGSLFSFLSNHMVLFIWYFTCIQISCCCIYRMCYNIFFGILYLF